MKRLFEKKFVGVTMMILTAVLFSTMALFVRLASASIPVGEIVFARYFLSTLFLLALARTGAIAVRPVNRKLLYMRAVAASFGGLFYFFAVADITIAEAVILKYLYPFFAVLIAALLYGEKTDRTVFALIIMSVTGVVIMVNPGSFDPRPGYAWGILNGLSAGAAVAFLRRLRETDDSSTIMFYTSVMGMAVSAPFLLRGVAFPSGLPLMFLFVAAACGIAAQFALVYGMRYIRTGAACVVMTFEVVLSSLLGLLVLGHVIDLPKIAGGLLILGGGFTLILRESGGGGKGTSGEGVPGGDRR